LHLSDSQLQLQLKAEELKNLTITAAENRLLESTLYQLTESSVTYDQKTGLSTAFNELIKVLFESYFKGNNYQFLAKVISAISISAKGSSHRNQITMWLSQTNRLHDAIVKQFYPGQKQIKDTGLTIIPKEGNKPVEDDPNHPNAKRLISELKELAFTIYSHLLDVSYEQIKPQVAPALLETGENETKLALITDILSTYHQAFKKHYLLDSVMQQYFYQVYYFINASLFNKLLENKSTLCTCANGFKIKQTMAELEDWGSHRSLKHLDKPLEHVIQAVNVLVMVDKAIFMDKGMIQSLFPILNFAQIKRILELFQTDDLSPDPVPPEVLQFLATIATRDEIQLHETAFV